MHIAILNIGDELLVGQTANTNASWLGRQLTSLGANVTRVAVVGDDRSAIHDELEQSLASSDVVVLTGGLGPTHDDITRETVAEFFGLELVFDERVWDRIAHTFESRGRVPAESNRRQAMIPHGFEVIDNPLGTAPGLWYDTEDERVVVILPGVPRELHALMDEAVLPRLRTRHDLDVIEQRILRTAGIGESTLQEVVGDLSAWVDGERLRLAYQAGTDGVRLRLTATETSRKRALERIETVEGVLRECIGPHIYGVGKDSIEEVVGRMLHDRACTLATAESCTGGLLASRITDVPGASRYFRGGVVCYSNQSKMELIHVDDQALMEVGAVSRDVALQMAHGVRKRFGSDLGVAITGVAGPTGGTPEKPVGTVWIGIAHPAEESARRYQLSQDRRYNKEMSCTLALDRVRRLLASHINV